MNNTKTGFNSKIIIMLFLLLLIIAMIIGCGKFIEFMEGGVITFESNGGNEIVSQEAFGYVSKPENPTKEGHSFMGWYFDESFTREWDFENDMVEGDMTFYAKWEADTYTISYDDNNSTNGSAPTSQTKTYGESLTLATNSGNLVKTDHTLSGWNTSPDGTGTSYILGETYTENVGNILYAKWEADTYTISYDGNSQTSGSAPSDQTKSHGEFLTLATNSGNLVKTGYSLSGWNTSPDGTGTSYALGGSYNIDVEDTLYAQWTVTTYTISYDGNGFTSGSAPTSQAKTHGEPLTLATNSGNLVKTDHTLSGWNTSPDGTGTSYALGGTYTQNVGDTFYAQWTVTTYTISYNANGSTSGSAPSDQTKTHGEPLTLAANSGNLQKIHYTFGGWNTKVDGSGTTYSPGSEYSINLSDILYAKWIPDTYTISYNANGSTSGTTPSDQIKTHGEPLTLATNSGSLEKTDFRFGGWNTESNGVGTSYSAGESYTEEGGDILYALWNPHIDKVVASDGGPGDLFGVDIDISGDTMVIGSIKDNDNNVYVGGAYIFVRSGSEWVQQAILKATGEEENNDYLGCDVAIDGDTVILGAYGSGNSGAAYIYTRSGTTWSLQQRLVGSGETVSPEFFGIGVDIAGDTVVVTAPKDDNEKGAAYIFTRSGNTWSEQAKLTVDEVAVGDDFGNDVALSGDTVIFGAVRDNNEKGEDAGCAYIFTRSGSTWSQQTQLLANTTNEEHFGKSVDLQDNTVTILSNYIDNNEKTGKAYIYTRSGTSWALQQTISGLASEEAFADVAVLGDEVIIGAYLGDRIGRAHRYTRSGNTWSEVNTFNAIDGTNYDYFGYSVAISGNTVIVSSCWDDDKGTDSGSVYYFELQ